MLSETMWRGGSVSQTLAAAASLYLTDEQRWVYLVLTGGTGTATVHMPFARGIPNGTIWHIMTGTVQTQVDLQITNQSGSALDHYGKDGSAAQILIDVSDTTKWGSRPAVGVVLLDNTALSGQGTWRIFYWGSD